MKTLHAKPPRLANPPPSRTLGVVALFVYVLFIVYGSLYPFSGWRVPDEHVFALLTAPWPRYITRTDITTNILVYLPLGFLLAAVLRPGMRLRMAVVWAAVAGLVLSLAMEMLQFLLPGRVSSNLDIVTNGLGAFIGALLKRLTETDKWPGRGFFVWRQKWFVPGRMGDIGAILIGLWALSQLSLQPPSLIAGNLHSGFVPFWEAVNDFSRFKPSHVLIYMLEMAGFGLFSATIVRSDYRARPFLLAVFAGAIMLKFLAAAILVKGSALIRLLSLEALLGFGGGLVLLLLVLQNAKKRPYGLAILMLSGFIAAYWSGGAFTATPFAEWPKFSGNMLNITGLAFAVSGVWPFLAISHLLVRRAFGGPA